MERDGLVDGCYTSDNSIKDRIEILMQNKMKAAVIVYTLPGH